MLSIWEGQLPYKLSRSDKTGFSKLPDISRLEKKARKGNRKKDLIDEV